MAVEVEATEAAKTAGWVSPADYLTHVAGGRHGHGSRTLRTAHGLCGDRTSTLLALQAGDVSPEHAEVIVTVIDRLPVSPSLRDKAERVLIRSPHRPRAVRRVREPCPCRPPATWVR